MGEVPHYIFYDVCTLYRIEFALSNEIDRDFKAAPEKLHRLGQGVFR
jgi:hypothetical protein